MLRFRQLTFARGISKNFSTGCISYEKKRKPQSFSSLIHKKTPEEAVSNILYNTPTPASPEPKRHLINCLVRNEPGVLSRISSILAARDFNIDSIICAKTDISELSRMTIVLNESPSTVKQAVRQLEDLVPVWAVLDYTGTKVLERELLMAKISLLGPTPEQAIEEEIPLQNLIQTQSIMLSLSELTKLFQGRIIDISPESVIVELSAKGQRIDAFLALLKPYGILEAARSGCMVIPRASHLSNDESEKEVESQPQVDVTALPPGLTDYFSLISDGYKNYVKIYSVKS